MRSPLSAFPALPRAPFACLPLGSSSLRALRWNLATDFRFADGLPSVPITRSELHRTAHHYVIAFEFSGDAVRPVACVRDRRTDVGKRGTESPQEPIWTAEYCPLFLRLHPFCIDPREQRLAVYLDPACLSDTEPYSFFESVENESAALTLIRRRAEVAAQGYREMADAARRLHDANLLVPLVASDDAQADIDPPLFVVSSDGLQQRLPRYLSDWAIQGPITIELALVAAFSLGSGRHHGLSSPAIDDARPISVDALTLTPSDRSAAWLDEDDTLRF